MSKNNITDYDIQALVDNELQHEDAKKVCAYIEKSAQAQKRYHELVEQKIMLKTWWKTQIS